MTRCSWRPGGPNRSVCRTLRLYGTTSSIHPIPRLTDGSLSRFQQEVFIPSTPALLPRGHFKTLPAVQKWFNRSHSETDHPSLNTAYLQTFSTTIVPLEIIAPDGSFARIDQPLSSFLAEVSHSEPPPRSPSIYLAQAPIADLSPPMQADLPTPDLVRNAGKGDVYDSSIWLGRAPTYTPLHRDPNPNLFVQLAGRKRIRVYRPDMGGAIFAHVQRSIGGAGNERFRGAEMMEGREREVLEQVVWGRGTERLPWDEAALECEVEAGDGLFIPKGWWHSVKGVGQGVMTGSVRFSTDRIPDLQLTTDR